MPINTTTIAAALAGAVVVLAGFGIKKLFKKKIKLTGIKNQLEEADNNLRAAHDHINQVYQIFSAIEERQEEIMK